MLKLILIGVAGRMGKALTKVISETKDLQLVGAIETDNHPLLGRDAGEVAGLEKNGVKISSDLEKIINDTEVIIEFSQPQPTLHWLLISRRHLNLYCRLENLLYCPSGH